MNRRRFPVIVLAVLGVTIASAQSPAPGSQVVPGKPGTAVIAGTLVDGSTGAPVTSAVVTLWPPSALLPLSSDGTPIPDLVLPAGSPQPLRALVDASGHFVFHSLPAGQYSLSAARPGYLATFFGQTQPKPAAGGGRRLQLADDARVADITLKIWKLAAISGTVLDESGEPAVGLGLRLLATGPASARPYRMYLSTQTDDRGMFRFGSLPPGDYIVVVPAVVASAPAEVTQAFVDEVAQGPTSPSTLRTAIATAAVSMPTTVGVRIGDFVIGSRERTFETALRPDGKLWAYPATYYPAATSLASATVVGVASGEDRKGVNVALRPVPTSRVSGTVVGPTGPMAFTLVNFIPAVLENLAPAPTMGGEVAQTITRADGTFTALGLPVGEYVMTALKMPTASPGGTRSGAPAVPAEPLLWGRTTVSVGSADVDRIMVRMAPGPAVSGRLVFEPGATPAPAVASLVRPSFTITPLDARAGSRPGAAAIAGDGTFRSASFVPGRYTLNPPTVPGWTIKSVVAGGRELIGHVADLTSDLTDVVVTYTDRAGDIVGTVTKSDAGADVTALLVPITSRASSPFDLPRMRSTAVSTDGTFGFGGVLAGDYVLAAVVSFPSNAAQRTDAMMAAWLARGVRISVTDRQKQSVTLQVIR